MSLFSPAIKPSVSISHHNHHLRTMKLLRAISLTVVLSLSLIKTDAQALYFPPIAGNTWDTLSPAALGWCSSGIDSLYDYLGQRNTKAFILLKDGKIVLERYFGSFTVDSLWYWASAGKTLTSYLTGIAQQEGRLSLQDTTSAYLGNGWTSCPPAKEDMITIRHQLTMTTGLDDGVADPYCTTDTCLHYLADAGTRWAYHNAPYTLLDSVLEVATGNSINQYVSQKLTQTTGMAGFFFRSGYNNVFFSKARSMARFGLLILNHGNWNGNQLMTDTAYFRQMVNTSQPLNRSYGYLWWLNGKSSFMVPTSQIVFPGSWSPNAPPDMFAALGKNGQLLNIVPGMNLVWLRLGDQPTGGDVPFTLNDTIWQKLNLAMCTSTRVETFQTEGMIKLFPNPAHGSIQITNPYVSPVDVSVSDVLGHLLIQQTISVPQSQLDISTLAPGSYFIRITSAQGATVARRIVVY
jgi:CubicO group peptidase (beta-lactamase class C family)